MSDPVKLRYHQTTLDLLGAGPVFSEKATERIERAEKRCRCALPASVREWYLLKNANSLVSFDEYHLTRRRYLLRGFVSPLEGKQPLAARLPIHQRWVEWYRIS